MLPKDLFAVAIGAMAVWFMSISIVAMLSSAIGQEFSSLIVGLTLLAAAGFIWRSAPWRK